MPIVVVVGDLSANSASSREYSHHGFESTRREQTPSLLRPSSSEELLPSQMRRPIDEGVGSLVHEIQERRKARGEDTSHGFLLSNREMESVLNLRAYRVSRDGTDRPPQPPQAKREGSRSTPSTGRRLIGEYYYPKKEEIVTVKKNRTKDAFSQGVGNSKINLQYRKVIKLKKESKQRNTHENLQSKIRLSEARMNNVKYGIPLLHLRAECVKKQEIDESQNKESYHQEMLSMRVSAESNTDGIGSVNLQSSPRKRSDQDLFRRAVNHVTEYSESAAAKLFSMEAEIKAYIEALRRDLSQSKLQKQDSCEDEGQIVTVSSQDRPKLPAVIEFYERLLEGNSKDLMNHTLAPDATPGASHLKDGRVHRGGAKVGVSEKRLSLMERLNKIQSETCAAGTTDVSSAEAALLNSNQQSGAIDGNRGLKKDTPSEMHREAHANDSSDAQKGSTHAPTKPRDMPKRKINVRSHRKILGNDNYNPDSTMGCPGIGSHDLGTTKAAEENTSLDEEDADPLGPNNGFMQQLLSSRRFRAATEQTQSPHRRNGGWRRRQKIKSLQVREKRLFAATVYDNHLPDAPSKKIQIGSDEAHNAARLADAQIASLRDCLDAEIRTMTALSKQADAVFDEVAHTSAHLLSTWEQSQLRVARQDGLFINDITSKEKDWERNISIKFDALIIDNEAEISNSKLHAVGAAAVGKDLSLMRKRVQDAQFRRELDNLLRYKWFIALVIRLQRRTSSVFTSVPHSCVLFLLAARHLFGLGEDLSVPLFYQLVEKYIDPSDQRDVIVHRTLQAFREALQISGEDYLDYLESKEIQPCPELMSHVRELREESRIAPPSNISRDAFIHSHRNAILSNHKKSMITVPPEDMFRRGLIASIDSLREGDEEEEEFDE